MKTKARKSLVHPLGEGELDFKFLPAGGRFHLRGSDEALTAHGGLVAWDHFLERCGVFAELARCYPLPRTSPNATPVIDILKAFSLNCLVGGTRFAHCRRLQDDTRRWPKSPACTKAGCGVTRSHHPSSFQLRIPG